MITDRVILAAIKNPPERHIIATQGETASRRIIITVLNENYSPLELTGKSVVLYVCKNDGNIVETLGTVNGHEAAFDLLTQCMTCPGPNEMFIQIMDESVPSILRIDGMILDVKPCNADNAQPSETVLTAAQEATLNANQAAHNANAAAERADSAVNDAESLFRTHVNSKNNPHQVTAAQVGALPTDTIETGTFTPKLIDRSTGTEPSYTYTKRNGIYFKIGKLVYISAYISGVSGLASFTSGQRAGVGGLPYASDSNGTNNAIALGSYYDLFADTADGDPITAYLESGKSYISLSHTRGGNGAQFSQSKNNGNITISGCYITA